jgi:hypothetical protein
MGSLGRRRLLLSFNDPGLLLMSPGDRELLSIDSIPEPALNRL